MSKSVKLRMSEAATGTTKKSVITESAGTTNSQPGLGRHARTSAPLGPVEEPAPFLEDGVDVAIERGDRPVGRRVAADRALGVVRDLVRDALPLGDLGRRAHRLELGPEGARVPVLRERLVVPRGLP